MTDISAADLVVGRSYRVSFDDCCVQGNFTGVFTGIRVVDDQGEPFEEAIVFDVGELSPVEWGQWRIEELS